MKCIHSSQFLGKIVRLALLVIVGMVLSGCVIGRRTITLPMPTAPSTTATANKAALIEAVSDRRAFMDKPADPSVPSLKDPISKVSPEERKHAIGRQRNTYGKAIGDIFLEGNVTVEDLARQLVRNGLEAAGYKVSSDAGEAGSSAVHLKVTIREFWAWLTPGLWSATMEAKLTTDVEIELDGKQIAMQVKGYGKNSVQVAVDRNWQQTYQRCFDDYLRNFDLALVAHHLSTK